MTVKELIMEVGFDDLLPYLKEIIVGHFDNIYAFREAYDILRDMQPNPEFVGKSLDRARRGLDKHTVFRRGFLVRMNWLKSLFAPNTTLSKEKIAAHCIYDITFYGFFSAERIENFWKSHAPMQSKMERRKSIIQELNCCLEAVSRTKIWLIYCKWNTVHDMIIIPLPTDKETD